MHATAPPSSAAPSATRTPPPSHLVAALAQELVRLSRASHGMKAALASARRPGDVEWAAYVLLFHLVRGGAQRSSALADAVHADPSTVSRQVAQLVHLGLVERRPDPDDGRAALLAATDAGVEVYRRMAERRDHAVGLVVDEWSAGELEQLTTLMSRLNDGFDAKSELVATTLSSTPFEEPAR